MAAFNIRGADGLRLAVLHDDHVTIGREATCEIVLADDALVSRRHAVVEARDGGWWIRDCGSRNGTRVNGTRLADAVPLHDADEVRIGTTTLVFAADAADPNATLVERDARDEAVALSEREREIVACVAGGLTDKAIAQRLGVTVATVRSHLERVRDKTGRRRRADLARLAHELALEPRR